MKTLEPGHRTALTALGPVVEAWGPTRGECFSEAVHGLVETFADVSWSTTSEPAPVHVDRDEDTGLLAALLEEVLSLLHLLGVVPVDGAVVDAEDGGLAGCLDVVTIANVRLVGPLPRAVTNHWVARGDDEKLWRCQVVVER